MTTALTPTLTDAAAAFREVVGVLAAVGGRFAWRLWWPLALWPAALATNRVLGTLAAAPEASAWLPGLAPLAVSLTEPAFVVVLWLWGARFALTLGHGRLPVYAVTATCSLLLPMLHAAVPLQVAALIAGGQVIVATVQVSEPASVAWAIALAYLQLPAPLVPICAGFLRRGAKGALLALGGVATLTGCAIIMATTLVLPLGDVAIHPAALLAWLLMIPWGWILFRGRAT